MLRASSTGSGRRRRVPPQIFTMRSFRSGRAWSRPSKRTTISRCRRVAGNAQVHDAVRLWACRTLSQRGSAGRAAETRSREPPPCRGAQEDRRLGEIITYEPVSLRVVQREEERHAWGGRHGARGPDPIERSFAVGGTTLPRVGSATLQGRISISDGRRPPRQSATLGALLGDCGARELAAHPRFLAGSRWHSAPTGGADRSWYGSRQNARVW